MNTFFRIMCMAILIITLLFLLIPFGAILITGLPFVLSIPYPKEILVALKLSLWTSLFASTVCTLVTIPIIYIKNICDHNWNRRLSHLFSLPMATPHLVSGIALLIVFGQKGIGAFLSTHFHIDFVYTVHGIWLAMLFINLPYSILTLDGAYNVVDKKLLFTGRTLGLSEYKVFFYIIIPMLKKALIALWMMNWARSIGEFGAIMILVGVTRMKTETLATSIFLNLSTGDFDVAAGVSSLLLLISMSTMFLLQKLIKEKDLNGS